MGHGSHAWDPEETVGNANPEWLAQQAARLVESLEQSDHGALATRSAPGGEPVVDRPAIAAVAERQWRNNVATVMWTIHSNDCPVGGECDNAYNHKGTAEKVVRALNPLPSRPREIEPREASRR